MAPKKIVYEQYDAVAASDQVKKLENGSLDPVQKMGIVKLDVTPCSNICKINTRHPDCLCGLVPAQGSWRKKGLWRKDSTLISSIGQDPALREREVGAWD